MQTNYKLNFGMIAKIKKQRVFTSAKVKVQDMCFTGIRYPFMT